MYNFIYIYIEREREREREREGGLGGLMVKNLGCHAEGYEFKAQLGHQLETLRC